MDKDLPWLSNIPDLLSLAKSLYMNEVALGEEIFDRVQEDAYSVGNPGDQNLEAFTMVFLVLVCVGSPYKTSRYGRVVCEDDLIDFVRHVLVQLKLEESNG